MRIHHRKRARTAKVRTGCITCKQVIRRIKCDEEKPECLRCSSTGRKCDGYEVFADKESNSEIKTPRPRSLSITQGMVTQGLISGLDADAQERRAFHFFCQRTAFEISGYLPSEFWERLLLQASHTDPAILHAVIALGSLHEIYEEHSSRCLENGEALNRRQFALQQSNKAIQHLSSQLCLSPPSGEVILICCLLFICLETFQGDYQAALSHLNSGLNLLGSLMNQNRYPALQGETPVYHDRDFVEKTLAPLFVQLDLQGSTYLTKRIVNYKLLANNLDAAVGPPIPTAFTTLTEAHESLNNQLHFMLHYEHEAWQKLADARELAQANVMNIYLPDALLQSFLIAQSNQRAQLEQWLQTLNAYLTDSSHKMGSKELRGAVVLKIHHITCRILLESTLYDHETGFDELIDEFEQIVLLAETLSNIPSSTPIQAAGKKPAYSFDMGILPPLYCTAVRCRDPIIRRKALALLSASPRREGVWDSAVLAAVVRWVIWQEEGDLNDVTCAEDVPISRRILVMERSLRVAERRIWVKYKKGQQNENNGLKHTYDEAWISW